MNRCLDATLYSQWSALLFSPKSSDEEEGRFGETDLSEMPCLDVVEMRVTGQLCVGCVGVTGRRSLRESIGLAPRHIFLLSIDRISAGLLGFRCLDSVFQCNRNVLTTRPIPLTDASSKSVMQSLQCVLLLHMSYSRNYLMTKHGVLPEENSGRGSDLGSFTLNLVQFPAFLGIPLFVHLENLYSTPQEIYLEALPFQPRQ